MTNSLNLSIVEGRVVRTAELLYTKNGHAICKFDLAVNESFKSDDEYKTVTSFITINAWEKLAQTYAKYLEKGTAIRVTGAIKQNNWEDKEGNKRSDLYINATTIDFLDWDKNKKEKNA